MTVILLLLLLIIIMMIYLFYYCYLNFKLKYYNLVILLKKCYIIQCLEKSSCSSNYSNIDT
eukprot:UN06482